MEFVFETLDYQQDAINATVKLFEGQPEIKTFFSLDGGGRVSRYVANSLDLTCDEIGKNLNDVQKKYACPVTQIGEHGLNFSVEMETGTGKTYVYLRTIFELNRVYGWKKFVIVVPSVAIREGVLQTLRATEKHFAAIYDNPIVQKTVYEGGKLSGLKSFAEADFIQILVMNIQGFNKDTNIINKINESGIAPIEWIRRTRPILIIDEPQNMEADKSAAALDSLNPLFTLRYSATPKKPYHKIYSLNPVQAYEKNLVKQIEVFSVTPENDVNGAYISLKGFDLKSRTLKAKVEIHFQDKTQIKKKTVGIKSGDDLFDKSGKNESYRNGFIVNEMDSENGEIKFSNGRVLSDAMNDVRDDLMKRQMRTTIREHLNRERKLNPKGIKVLSLFFIDKVANYREDGKFYKWFEEIYRDETKGENPEKAHGGYFARDNKGNAIDSKGTSKEMEGAEKAAYQLIMKDKESLLSLDNPLRFIFSHSALREGWDNPNVFQICTLNETNSPFKKRQEIGRGLRLPVNQNGERIRDKDINVLSIVANESYKSFADKLQKEYEEECDIKFASENIKDASKRRRYKYRKGFMLDPKFKEIWEKLRWKTTYRVQYDSDALVINAGDKLKKMPEIQELKINVQKASIDNITESGIEINERRSGSYVVNREWEIPDVLGEIQKKTNLTRHTVFRILDKSGRIEDIRKNPQRFIDLASEKINTVLQELMVNGIKYQSLNGQEYEMRLLEDLELKEWDFYENNYTFCIKNENKTIYADFIPLDSNTENDFARDCENYEEIQFYFKLPHWFKIPTPISPYNPDWAVVFKRERKVYFVAETKNTGEGIQKGVDWDELRNPEAMKIICAQKHFECFPDVKYETVKTVSELSEKINS